MTSASTKNAMAATCAYSDQIADIATLRIWAINRQSTSITASARPSSARDGAAGQLLRKASVVLDARATPDDFINLGGVISWIKSLSASVSNGLRSMPKFGGAAFAASLSPVVRAMGKL